MASSRRRSSGPSPEDAERAAADRKVAQEAAKDMFTQVATHMSKEMAASSDDYVLLAKLNAAATEKYKGVADKAAGLTAFMGSLDEELKPHLDQIDSLHDNVAKLEQVVDKLDEYSRRLEAQFVKHYNSV